METQTQAVAKAAENKPPAKTIRDLLQGEDFRKRVEKSLPKHLKPERFIGIALTAMTKTPKLMECTQESFFKCLLDLSAVGLEPDGRRAHLIPFNNKRANRVECQLIVDYKGLAELVRRSGEVASLRDNVVCENDEFDYEFGDKQFLRHKPAHENRGKVIAAYVYIKHVNGGFDFDVMNVEEVEKIRSRSRSADSGPWVTDWNEMAKKTVFRRMSKTLPFSSELREAIEIDDEPFAEHDKFMAARPVFANAPSFLDAPKEYVPEPETQHEPATVGAQ